MDFFNFLIMIKQALLILATLSLLISCSGKDNTNPDDPPVPVDYGKARVWLTRGDKTKLFSMEGELLIKKTGNVPFAAITIDTAIQYQQIEGYGAALTGSSAYLLNRVLSAPARNSVLNELFNPSEGIGISYLRLTMGASDFSLSNFSYDDMPAGQTDSDLSEFTLAQDLQDVVPVLGEIVSINGDIKLMGSPWSAPAWMKTNKIMLGGKLDPQWYSTYAQYFVKYIQAMQEHGIRIDAITPQNEPLYFTASYPCMEMQSNDQLVFVRDHLGPAFQQSSLNTKIVLYDHNWDNTSFAINILNDPQAAQYVTGTAFHGYAGDVSAMGAMHTAHPEKSLYFTEISGGAWAVDFTQNLLWNMRNIFVGAANNWSTCSLLWNLALNEEYGPTNNGCSNCRGVITINSGSGQIIRNEEYYSIAHFSKFVRPGAHRIDSKMDVQLNASLGVVCFQNQDLSKVLVVTNYANDSKTFVVRFGDSYFQYTIPAASVASIVW